jgi:hypothetical protein
MQGSGERPFLIKPRASGQGRAKRAKEKCGGLSSDEGCSRAGDLKDAAAPFRHSHASNKRNTLSQERSFFLFLLFSALRARLLHPLAARAPFLPFGRATGIFFLSYGATGVFSSFGAARRKLFFLSYGATRVFLSYSGFLSIAA